jgi:hypothetical protein
MSHARRLHAVSALLAALCIGPAAMPAFAADIAPGGDLRAAIAALKPGEELRLGGGTYINSSAFHITVSGTASQPIVIRAKDGEHPVIQQTNTGQNGVEIQANYLVFRGIEFVGGSHGIRLIDSDFITIEDCEVHDTGDVAISANSGGN